MEFIDVFSLIITRVRLRLFSTGSAKVRWKLKHLLSSQLCEKYFCQKLLKSANLYLHYDR